MITVGILAGGLGTRISEETQDKPKPMVLINGTPILGHLIDSLRAKGAEYFYVAVGYKGDVIESWIKDAGMTSFVKVIDTGENSSTGSRVKQLLASVGNTRMLVTYGDGLANVSLAALIRFHLNHGKYSTITAVHPPPRFGHIEIEDTRVTSFNEKDKKNEGWINGGFFVLEPEVQDYIVDKSLPFEVEALPKLAKEGNLMAYRHEGFWKAMDTLRDKHELEELARGQKLPWMN